jgi:hypothetical protein
MDKKLRLTLDVGGSQCTKDLINHLKKDLDYNQDLDQIRYNPIHKYSEVFYDYQYIAKIDKKNNRVILPYCHNKSKKIKERLNRILMAFCGCQLFQNNRTKEWFLVVPSEKDKLITETIVVPF